MKKIVFFGIFVATALTTSFLCPRAEKRGERRTGSASASAPPDGRDSLSDLTETPSGTGGPEPTLPETMRKALENLKINATGLTLRDLCHLSGAEATLAFEVRDENGVPLPGVNISAAFSVPSPKMLSWEADVDFTTVENETDGEGRCLATAKTSSFCNWKASLGGYYGSSGTVYAESRFSKDAARRGKWTERAIPVPVTLKKKKRTVANGISRKAAVYVPFSDSPVEYDLLEGDWVAPFGKGITGDLAFFFPDAQKEPDAASRDAPQSLVISTPDGAGLFVDVWNAHDSLPWRTVAPECGYVESLEFVRNPDGKSFSYGDGKRFGKGSYLVFRSRCRADAGGNADSALYGKIDPGMRFGWAPREKGAGSLVFRYSVNPEPGDRSLEFPR